VLTDRNRATVNRDYPGQAARVACDMLERLGDELSTWREVSEGDRVERAALRYAQGDLDRLNSAVELALRDWRDLLVAVGDA
jgi:hypothetical protein